MTRIKCSAVVLLVIALSASEKQVLACHIPPQYKTREVRPRRGRRKMGRYKATDIGLSASYKTIVRGY